MKLQRIPRGIALGLGLAAALLPGGAAAAPPAQEPGLVRETTAHYQLTWAGTPTEAKAMGVILEATWPELRSILQAEPELARGERLDFRFLADKARWNDVMLDDKQVVPPAADPVWCSNYNGVLYGYRHASEIYTRMMVIYGAALQYHARCKQKNSDLDTSWYVHGLAQTLSVHTWDGFNLKLAVRPKLCVVDHPAKALLALGGAGDPADAQDPWQEERIADPYVSWACVRFALYGLKGKHRARYQKLALGHSGSKVSGADFMRSLGRERDVSREFRAWLKNEQYPLEIVHGEWEELPNGRLRGGTARPEDMSTVLVRDPEAGFACQVHGIGQPGVTRALLLSWSNAKDYVLARFEPPVVKIQFVRNELEVDVDELMLPDPAADTVAVRVQRLPVVVKPHLKNLPERPAGIALTIGDKTYDRIPVPEGRVGLAVLGGRAEFSAFEPR